MYLIKEGNLEEYERDYAAEYAKYHSSPEQKRHRAARNRARRHAMAKGLVKVGDGKEVDHIIPLSMGGSYDDGNTRILSQGDNRIRGNRFGNDDEDLMGDC